MEENNLAPIFRKRDVLAGGVAQVKDWRGPAIVRGLDGGANSGRFASLSDSV
jgi:hypothetical protein